MTQEILILMGVFILLIIWVFFGFFFGFFSESRLSLPGAPIAESTHMDQDFYQMSPPSRDLTMETDPTMPDATYTIDTADAEMEDLSTCPERPSALAEDTLPDATIPMKIPDVGAQPEVTYDLFDGATRSGNTLLVDSNMYTYNEKAMGQKKLQRPGKATWHCSVRSKSLTCRSSVLQDSDTFTHGLHPHIHPADPTAAMKARVTAKVKGAAADKGHVVTPVHGQFKIQSAWLIWAVVASHLVGCSGDVAWCWKACSRVLFRQGLFNKRWALSFELVEQALAEEDPAARFPAPGHIARAANQVRRNNRPDEPRGLDFELSMDYIPDDFLVKDIRSDSARHVIFAAPQQLALLSRARTWYLDGTFKITREPFHQLNTLHAFIKGDCGNIKQVPLAYTYMMRPHKKDEKKYWKPSSVPSRLSHASKSSSWTMSGLCGMLPLLCFQTLHVRAARFTSVRQSGAKCRTLDLLSPTGTMTASRI